MKNLKKSLACAVLAGTMMVSVPSVKACGPCGGWLSSVIASNQDTFNYLVVEGQTLFKGVVKGTIKSLVQLYFEHPTECMMFVSSCLNDSSDPLPDRILDLLKTFNLIQSDARVSDVVKLVVSMVVEKDSATGQLVIWSLDNLIKDGWMTPA